MNTLSSDFLSTAWMLFSSESSIQRSRARELASNIAGRITLVSEQVDGGIVAGEDGGLIDFYDVFTALVDVDDRTPIHRWMLAETAAAGIAAAQELTTGQPVTPVEQRAIEDGLIYMRFDDRIAS